MSKIAPDHLARAAFVYVRQSTAYQVANNLESQRRQYALVERARQLGWNDVQLIDDDLGKSGGGTVRPDFRSCWPRSAKAALALSCRWKLHAWRGTAVTGTRYLSSVAWSAR